MLIIDQHVRYIQRVNIGYQLLRHTSGDYHPVHIAALEEARCVLGWLESVAHRGHQEIVIFLAGLQLCTQQNAAVKELGAGEVYIGNDKAHIAGPAGDQIASGLAGMIVMLGNYPLHPPAGLSADITVVG